MIDETLGRLAAGEDLSTEQMSSAVEAIMQGQCDEPQIALFLTALRTKGETADEIVGAAKTLRRHMVTIHSNRDDLLDTCGTGGDRKGTFNISTAAAIVTAAAGVPVAKHGNRSVSSKTGSSDVLSKLGVNIEATVGQVEACLDELGICFCFAPLFHPAMKQVAAVRKTLGVPTIFNLLGPLANPARAPYQLLGVGRANARPLIAKALPDLGVRRAMVVRGEDGLDELTLDGRTAATLVEGGNLREISWTPEDFGLDTASLDPLCVESADESAAIIRELLDGTRGPARDIVVLNAAAALFVAGVSDQPTECAAKVAEAIDTGGAKDLLARLAARSHA